MFGNLRTVVIDEIHAFAGDDRGWHLLAVLERLSRIAGRTVQRVGPSATVGDPDSLLGWLKGGATPTSGRILNPPDVGVTNNVEVTVDHVGSLDNAALVISRLHRGEKRLVFADSRAAVESLAASLRDLDVTTFVSHGSLSVDERRQAERAFTEARDCVIVATSTLELGVDVGDLDRVIQIDCPRTVASFLQRFGRTGRRQSAARNCLFLCVRESSLLQTAGLLSLWLDGWVEPVVPPPEPAHLLAQQIMALSLQEGQIGRELYREWIGRLPPFAALHPDPAETIIQWMLDERILVDEAGMLSFGIEGEQTYGRRHFLDLISAFTTDPLMTVWHGRKEIGQVAPLSLQRREDDSIRILLAGRSWSVTEINWPRRIVMVIPSEDRGRSRWPGGGPTLSYELCQAMARVVDGHTPAVRWSRRGTALLETFRAELAGSKPGETRIATADSGRLRWWTFGGGLANAALAEHLDVAESGSTTDLSITISPQVTRDEAVRAIAGLSSAKLDSLRPTVSPAAVSGLKFNECLPTALAQSTLAARLWDPHGVAAVLRAPIEVVAD